MLLEVEKSLLTRRLLKAGQRLLVAVSGGLDSMVLLDVLHRLAATHRWRLIVAHFNHQLRGAASAADERLVRSTARKLRIPIVCGVWPREEHASAKQFGLEMAARLARHRFLAGQARRARTPSIALAHHADDQVELFFLRLLRGSGGEGLPGMKWQNPSPADAGLTLIRPLLDLRKIDLIAYARERKIRYRNDASNLDKRHDRNWIRARLLPALTKRFGVTSVNSILRTMALIGDESDYARAAAETWQDDCGGRSFEALHPAVQRQFVRQQLKGLGLPPKLDLIEQLRRPLRVPVTAAPGFLMRRNSDGTITRCELSQDSFREETIEVVLANPGKCTFAEVSVAWSHRRATGLRKPLPAREGQEWFDATQIGERVQLRHWRPGDQFQPIGMTSPKKLQDLFTNMKIPRASRRELVVAEAAGGEIFWVEGLRISERFKVGPATRIRLHWTWNRRPPRPIQPGEKE